MPVTRDIAASYAGPRRVMRRLLDQGVHEGRALAILMGACVLIFVAQWPRLSREAYLTGQDLQPMLGGALLGWVFIAPLIFYTLALLSHWVLRLLGGQNSAYSARLALFWALMVSVPVLLLYGLVAGFIGAGTGLSVVGLIWIAVFLWVWISNLIEAGWGHV